MRPVVERHHLHVLHPPTTGEAEPVVLADVSGEVRWPQVVVGLALPRDALVFAHQPRDVLIHEEIPSLTVLDVGERRGGGEEVGEPGLRRLCRALRPDLRRHVIGHDDVTLGRPRPADRRRRQAQLEDRPGSVGGGRAAGPDLTAIERRLDVRSRDGPELLGEDLEDGGADHARPRLSEQPLRGTVPAVDPVFGIGSDDGLGERVEQQADARDERLRPLGTILDSSSS